MSDPTPSQSGATEMQASEPQTQPPQASSAGPGQAAPDVAQAVAASNASTSASLSTALSTAEASADAVSSAAPAVSLSTSIAPAATSVGVESQPGLAVAPLVQEAPAASGEPVGGTSSASGPAVGGNPSQDSCASATAMPSTAADPDTGSIRVQPVPTTAAASSGAGDAPSLGSNVSVSESNSVGAPVVSAPDPVTPLGPGGEQTTPNTPAYIGGVTAPMLARLHADLEELERKIGQGIHVFAHEVAAIRDQLAKLI